MRNRRRSDLENRAFAHSPLASDPNYDNKNIHSASVAREYSKFVSRSEEVEIVLKRRGAERAGEEIVLLKERFR